MTSCGGMLRVIVRRSTFTIRSTIGIRRKRPGPFGSARRRPRRNTIPRSYSRATLIAEIRNSTSRNRRIAMMTRAAATLRVQVTRAGPHEPRRVRHRRSILNGFDGEDEAVARLDANVLTGLEGPAVLHAGLPQLAVDEDESVSTHLADRTCDPLGADADRAAPRLPGLADCERPQRAEAERDADHQRLRRVIRRGRVLEQHDRADRETDEA